MVKISELHTAMQDDIEAVQSWANDMYTTYFKEYFQGERDLYERLTSKTRPITNEELEWILTTLPLELFSVAEYLSQFKLNNEVAKLKAKQKESELAKSLPYDGATKRKEEASIAVLEDKLLITAYSTVITRVESEMTFSREVIMSAKKIWDSRRAANDANPVGNVVPESEQLPEYDSNIANNKAYIR